MKDKTNKILYVVIQPQRSGGTTFNKHLLKNFSDEEVLSPVKEENPLKSLKKKSPEELKKLKFLTGHYTYYGIHKFFPDKESRYITFVRDPARRLVSRYNKQMSGFKPKDRISFDRWYNLKKKNDLTLFLDERYNYLRNSKRFMISLRGLYHKLNDAIAGSGKRNILVKSLLKFFRKNNRTVSRERNKLENAKKLLDKCWFIGTENFERDFKILFNKLNIPLDWKKDFNFPVNFEKLLVLDEKLREKIYKENPLDVELCEYAKKLNKTMIGNFIK